MTDDSNKTVVERLIQKRAEEEQERSLAAHAQKINEVDELKEKLSLQKTEYEKLLKESERRKDLFENQLVQTQLKQAELQVGRERHEIETAALTLNIKILGEALLQYQQQEGDEDDENK